MTDSFSNQIDLIDSNNNQTTNISNEKISENQTQGSPAQNFPGSDQISPQNEQNQTSKKTNNQNEGKDNNNNDKNDDNNKATKKRRKVKKNKNQNDNKNDDKNDDNVDDNKNDNNNDDNNNEDNNVNNNNANVNVHNDDNVNVENVNAANNNNNGIVSNNIPASDCGDDSQVVGKISRQSDNNQNQQQTQQQTQPEYFPAPAPVNITPAAQPFGPPQQQQQQPNDPIMDRANALAQQLHNQPTIEIVTDNFTNGKYKLKRNFSLTLNYQKQKIDPIRVRCDKKYKINLNIDGVVEVNGVNQHIYAVSHIGGYPVVQKLPKVRFSHYAWTVWYGHYFLILPPFKRMDDIQLDPQRTFEDLTDEEQALVNLTFNTIKTILNNPKKFPLTQELFNILFIYGSMMYNLWIYYGDSDCTPQTCYKRSNR